MQAYTFFSEKMCVLNTWKLFFYYTHIHFRSFFESHAVIQIFTVIVLLMLISSYPAQKNKE